MSEQTKGFMKKFIEYKGARMCYTVEGEGYPVVLMHGWGCNHTTLASIEAALVPGMISRALARAPNPARCGAWSYTPKP